MTELFCYPIPDKYFAPHKVIKPFYAKVVYSVDGCNAKIEEIAFSPYCLEFINNHRGLVKDISKALKEAIEKKGNTHVHPTIMSAIAPHI
jgi:hypothetical protein